MAAPDPMSPLRADHRFIKVMALSNLAGKVEHVPSEFSMVSDRFVKAGGSWERIFHGAPGDMELLKKTLKQAFKSGDLTKKQNWGGSG